MIFVSQSSNTMLLLVSLMSLLAWANGQIIFPDEFDAMLKRYMESQRTNATSFLASPAASEGFQSPAVNSQRNDASFIPVNAYDDALTGQHQPGLDYFDKVWSDHVNDILAKGIGKFAIDMDRAIYRSLGETRGGTRPNVVFSPLSVVSTLAIVLLGSAGVTFDQVTRILGIESGINISAHSEMVHLMLGQVLKSIQTKSSADGPKVTMANGIFVQNDYPIRNEFRAISQDAYNNKVVNLDFIGRPELSRKIINDWVKENTEGKITGILDRSLDPDTKLIISSALYFRGEWNQYFFSKLTARQPFLVTPRKTVMVDMMFNGGEFPFHQDARLGVKMIGLPYKGYQNDTNNGSPPKPQTMMYILLPTAEDAEALSRLESRLNIDLLEALIGKMKKSMCSFAIPRMKLSSTLNLNSALAYMGLDSLFDPRVSNLALLSPGIGEESTSQRIRIGNRSGGSEDNEDPEDGNVTTNPETANKTNYFTYKDTAGGYDVKQWNNGVHIQKIPVSFHRRRSIDDVRGESETKRGGESTRRKRRNMNGGKVELNHESRSKSFEADDQSRQYDRIVRSKRQGRPIDEDFLRFIGPHNIYRDYGLDSLRNSDNLRNPGLFASDVLHKVEMDVTETGTEAAAATSILLQRGGDIKLLYANRPFLFFIRHESTRLILFWGTVNQPTPNY